MSDEHKELQNLDNLTELQESRRNLSEKQENLLSVIEDLEGRLLRVSRRLKEQREEVLVINKMTTEIRRILMQEFMK